MLKITDLKVSINDKIILNNLNLDIKKGEIHAIMGPNGSGKSTLSSVLTGNSNYTIDKGKILFNNEDLIAMNTYERACKGLFLAFQYPVEIPGLSMMNFLRTSVNENRKYKGYKEYSGGEFIKILKSKAKSINFDHNLLKRHFNEGFSGGEKKRNEILQMMMLSPILSVLDETDSGLDIDALKIIASGINNIRDKEKSFIIITHYQRLLNYITPDYVHILYNGKIVQSGDKNLAIKLENQGYESIKDGVCI
ncbi:MAG: Fe-S cluster assembly ATPase SufC [Bacteroides sp.]|nr:MAG: Fe-S cluster assembly ATPase SufC [Bacteroides sp.]